MATLRLAEELYSLRYNTMKRSVLIPIAFLVFCAAIGTTELFRVPKNWPAPVYNFQKNPLTQAKVSLGRKLFYDPQLSRNNLISCASCHSPYNAFTHTDHARSHGVDDRIGRRNSPALMNLAWQRSFMWDGAVNHLDMQALAPISHPDEMGSSLDSVIRKLRRSPDYRQLFASAFGDSSITGERVLKSFSQFLLTLVSDNSKYDQVMRGEQQRRFTENEEHGHELFLKHCNSCHREPLFTNNDFENNGLRPDSLIKDPGRSAISRRRSDSLKFKVPTLRNCELTAPYMHDGRYRNLQMVLFHYTTAIHDSPTLSHSLRQPITLAEQDKNDLIAFLKTLTDEDFVHNPAYRWVK